MTEPIDSATGEPATGAPATGEGVVAMAPPIDPRIRARRIEVRRRAGRRRLQRLVFVALVVVLVLVVVAVARSPLLDVDRIEVVGANLTGPDAVVAASGVQRGDRLVGVSPGAVADRVSRLPWVSSARALRRWPGTVRIEVAERLAVAALPTVGGGYVLLDASGWQAGLAGDVPSWIVRLEAEPIEAELGTRAPSSDEALLTVASSVPAVMGDRLVALREQAEANAGATGRGVEGTVRLPNGKTASVRFGPPDQLGRKWLAVITVLDGVDLARVTVIDVRVPNAPALTRS